MSKLDITAIILAAGQGTRLRPLTDHLPKCMVPVLGKPLLVRQLDTFEAAGIHKVIAVTGYYQESITDPRVTKVENPLFASTNMIESLLCAREYIKGDLIISYGDIVYKKEVLDAMLSASGDIIVATDQGWRAYWEERGEDPLADAESFVKGPNQTVRELGQKETDITRIEGQYIGLIRLTNDGCRMLLDAYDLCAASSDAETSAWGSPRPLAKAFMTDLMNHFAQRGQLHYAEINRGWFEVDNFTDLQVAERHIDF